MAEWITPKEAAKRLGMTAQSLGMWAVRQGAVGVRDGTRGREYHWPDFPRWREEELTRKARESARPANLEEARQRFESARAEMAELELEKAKGNLIHRDVYMEAVVSIHQRIRAQVLALPSKVAPLMVGLGSIQEAAVLLERAARDVLAELREPGSA